MKFWSRFDKVRYTMVPANYRADSLGRREHVAGIAADFVQVPSGGSVFDSVLAQQKNRWSDEQREALEHYLLEHGDFGLSLHTADTSDDAAKASGTSKPICQVILTDETGIHLCGEPIFDEGVCRSHYEELGLGPTEEPAGEPEPAEVT
jgi:hypothetical protein